jgi:hypothetical protein
MTIAHEIELGVAAWIGINVLFVLWRAYVNRGRAT